MNKPRIHYGSLENADLSSQSSSSVSQNVPQQQVLSLSEEAMSAQRRREQLLRELEIMNRAKTLLVTTDDSQVKLQLRGLGHPITLFGEGPGDRRDRLKLLLARSQFEQQEQSQQLQQIQQIQQQQATTDDMEIEEDELFFTEGSDELTEARLFIAQYSLQRSHARLKHQHQLYQQIKEQAQKPEALQTQVQSYKQMMNDLHNYESVASQIGDRRPVSSISVLQHHFMNKRLMLSSAWSGYVKIWDADSFQCLQTYKTNSERIVHAQFSPLQASDGSLSFATASADKTVKVWRVTFDESTQNNSNQMADEEENTHQVGENGLAVPQSNIRAVDTQQSNSTIKSSVVLSGHSDRLSRLCYHNSGRYIASTSYDMTWRLWDVARETCLYEQEGHSSAVYALAFHVDGSLCATSDLGGIIRVWDLRTGRTIIPLRAHVRQCLSLDFSPNGHYFASSSDDNTVKIWDLRRLQAVDDKPKSLFTIPAHNKLISRVQFEPSHGRFLTTASYDNTIRIWDSLEFKLIKTLTGHDNKIMYTDMFPGHLLTTGVSPIISCGYDRTLKMWSSSR